MRVFNNQTLAPKNQGQARETSTRLRKRTKSPATNGADRVVVHNAKPPRSNLSANEIRAKVAEAAKVKEEQRLEVIRKNTKQSSNFMNELTDEEKIEQRAKMLALKEEKEAKAKELAASNPNTDDFVLEGDVNKNNPNSIQTQSKLKDILANGGFEFNEKEKAALADILN